MSILIKDATIIAMDAAHGTEPFFGSILLKDDRICGFYSAPPLPEADTVIDGSNRLVMPGLVNAHIHSWETFLKGRYDNMPLEIWMLYTYPILGCSPLASHIIYLRSLLCGVECLKAGVTTIVDDVIEMPGQNLEQIAAVANAYEKLGIRAGVSGHIINVPLRDTMPYVSEVLPQEVQNKATKKHLLTADEYLAFSQEAIKRFHRKSGRINYILAPGGPQRCTPELLIGSYELAQAVDTAYHLHLLETKVQAIAGEEVYGMSLVKYLHSLGVLGNRTTLAHSIWVTDADIELMGSMNASVVHNPKSNMKLGSGIMPYRQLIDSGVNMALGSDGVASNDTPRMFDVMNLAALIHKTTTPDRSKWPTVDEILYAATMGGARSAMIGHETGSLEIGKKADAIVLDLDTLNFAPLNNIRNQLIYCENGSSIEYVIVDGEITVENGRVTNLDEEGLLSEIKGYLPEFQKHYAEIEELNRVFEPFIETIRDKSNQKYFGVNRYSGDL